MMKNSKEIDYEDLANKVSALFGNLLDNAVGTDEFLKVLSEYSAHKKDDKNETDSKNSNEKCIDNKITSENVDEKTVYALNSSIKFDEIYKHDNIDKLNDALSVKMSNVLDDYVFKMLKNNNYYSESELIISYINVTFGFKWNSDSELYELVYIGNDDDVDLKQYSTPVGYYDMYKKSLHLYNDKDEDDCTVKTHTEQETTLEVDDKAQNFNESQENVKNEISAKSLFEKCNAKKNSAVHKYIPTLKKIVDSILSNEDYDMYSDDYDKITSIVFPVSKLVFVDYNAPSGVESTVCLYKIFSRNDLERFLKDTYHFPEVTVGCNRAGEYFMENFKESYIKCYLV